jgi:hypothetical protein
VLPPLQSAALSFTWPWRIETHSWRTKWRTERFSGVRCWCCRLHFPLPLLKMGGKKRNTLLPWIYFDVKRTVDALVSDLKISISVISHSHVKWNWHFNSNFHFYLSEFSYICVCLWIFLVELNCIGDYRLTNVLTDNAQVKLAIIITLNKSACQLHLTIQIVIQFYRMWNSILMCGPHHWDNYFFFCFHRKIMLNEF